MEPVSIALVISVVFNGLGVLHSIAKKTPSTFAPFGIPIGKYDQDYLQIMMDLAKKLKDIIITK